MTDAERLALARALIADFYRNHPPPPPQIPTVAGYWATVRTRADAQRSQVSAHLPPAVRATIHRQIIGPGCACAVCAAGSYPA